MKLGVRGTMRKRFLTCLPLLIVLTAIILALPIYAADPTYDDTEITIMGTLVTPANNSDVLGDADGTAKSVSYDDATKTLTLNNANLEKVEGSGYIYMIDISSTEKITIELIGTSTLKNGLGITVSAFIEGGRWIYADLHITGSGTLNYDGGEVTSVALLTNGKFSMDSGKFIARSMSTNDTSGISTIDINADTTISGTAVIDVQSINHTFAAGDHNAPGVMTVSGSAKLTLFCLDAHRALAVHGSLEMIGGEISARNTTERDNTSPAVYASRMLFTRGKLTAQTNANTYAHALSHKAIFTEGASYTIKVGDDATSATVVAESSDYHLKDYVEIVSSFSGTIPRYSLEISPSEFTFPKRQVGYTEAPPPQTFTVTNTGTATLYDLTLEGDYDIDFFDLNLIGETRTHLPAGHSIQFTAQPREGLVIQDISGGNTYTADVTITTDRAIKSVRLSFSLTEDVPQYQLIAYSGPDDESTTIFYDVGEKITWVADATAPGNLVFKGWTGLEGVTFLDGTNQYSQRVSFVMPERSVVLKATYGAEIDSIKISPRVATVKYGESLDFYVFVDGETNRSEDVTWTLTGMRDTDNTVLDYSMDEAHRILNVSDREESTLTVRVEDKTTGTVFDEATVYVVDYNVTWFDVRVNGGMPSNTSYPANTILAIAADEPARGYTFDHWSVDSYADFQGNENDAVSELFIDDPTEVTANYARIPGDATMDSEVNIDDLLEILKSSNYNKGITASGANPFADLNGDGRIDFDDLALARNSKYFTK